tara:strand:+ start:556 stop:672 length:117 start_codon:yes stop_codon:yes gene_type:complete
MDKKQKSTMLMVLFVCLPFTISGVGPIQRRTTSAATAD